MCTPNSSESEPLQKPSECMQKEGQLCRFGEKYTNLWRQWHPTPVCLPGKFHGRRSLVGCSPWDRWESDTTEGLHFHFSLSCIGEGNGNPLQCSCLENPRFGGAWWAAVYGVAQSLTRLKQLSSGSKNTQTWAFNTTLEKANKTQRAPGLAYRIQRRHITLRIPQEGTSNVGQVYPHKRSERASESLIKKYKRVFLWDQS